MATHRIPRLQFVAGFVWRGVVLGLLGLLGSYLAAFMFTNLILALLIFNLAFFDSTAREESPKEFAAMPYAVPACIAIGCAVGIVWARRARPGKRWWRIVAASWAGLLVGGLPISGLLIFMAAIALVAGFLPGLLAGLIWATAIASLTLVKHWPLSDPEFFLRSARRLSAVLMLFIGPAALFVGWELPFGQGAIAALALDLLADDFTGDFVVVFSVIGLCSATAAWLLSPLLTRWYIRESRTDVSSDSPGSTLSGVPLDGIRVAGSRTR